MTDITDMMMKKRNSAVGFCYCIANILLYAVVQPPHDMIQGKKIAQKLQTPPGRQIFFGFP